MKKQKKITLKIGFTESDLNDLMDDESFNWVFTDSTGRDIEVFLFKEKL